jgi:hypothetical protein
MQLRLLHKINLLPVFIIGVLLFLQTHAQPSGIISSAPDYNKSLHYKPIGNDFILVKGDKKFNRALYGGNTAFRVEAGDQPEFAMYMPGMGGNCKIGIINGKKSKWITEANTIKTIYRAGSMLYEIKDSLLDNGVLYIQVLALHEAEGMIIKLQSKNSAPTVEVVIAYGAATGKKFSRDGDLGADPESSFYMKEEYCKDNIYSIHKNTFQLNYGFAKSLTEEERYEIQNKAAILSTDKGKSINGLFSSNITLQIADASNQISPLKLLSSQQKSAPVLCAKISIAATDSSYFLLQSTTEKKIVYNELAALFVKEDAIRKSIAERVTLETPDAFINPIGNALAIAADAIWDNPTYMHGAVAWRMRLPAWRGPYCADALGWHDRARTHFTSYGQSQITNINPGVFMPDSALHFARQLEKLGTAMFSNGYICRNPNGDIRPHHYDMNLVFVDALLNHFNYTGDTAYVKKMWPLIKLHLEWEKRNFDADGDGLYDAYCCIWASDALEYMSGGVTHSSAYNYRANNAAAMLAKIIGEDATAYEKEAAHIYNAMQNNLWLKEKGWYAEYKDLMGLQAVHPAAALWTVYHSVDENAGNAFQNYQLMQYVNHQIPHIPFTIKEMGKEKFHMLSTSNWQPYTWSINNVVLAENLHTALAYWQSNESNKAFDLWRSSLIESMYLGGSPANFPNISFQDVERGELFRDFADPIGMAARTLTEGLFGITPFALQDSLVIKPGFPAAWNFAKIALPDISVDFKKAGNIVYYQIAQHFSKQMKLHLQLKAVSDEIKSITINGSKANWHWIKDIVGEPMIEIEAAKLESYKIQIEYSGKSFEKVNAKSLYTVNSKNILQFNHAKLLRVYDPQQVLVNAAIQSNQLSFTINNNIGFKSVFVQLQQGNCIWYQPVSFEVKQSIEIKNADEENKDALKVFIINNSNENKSGKIIVNSFAQNITIKANDSMLLSIPAKHAIFGSNEVNVLLNDGTSFQSNIVNWNIKTSNEKFEMIDVGEIFNDKVNQIFQNKYLSPRPTTTTLQIPWQGIGNWCYPLADAVIDDSGLRIKAQNNNCIFLNNIPFATTSVTDANNIAFTSQWDNYPKDISVSLSGTSSHAYFLMAGSTNHMQSRFTNGKIKINYTDGSTDSLLLNNPENWYPIEQDYINNGFAFTTGAPKPYRLLLKTGTFTRKTEKYNSIKGVTNHAIDGGAATVLDMPLNASKKLKNLQLIATANEVIVGLMSITLVR